MSCIIRSKIRDNNKIKDQCFNLFSKFDRLYVKFLTTNSKINQINQHDKITAVPYTSGMIQGGWDMGTIVSSITMAYIGSQGHKTRWVALGTLLVSVACYSQLIPYILFGPGKDAVAIATQAGNTTLSLCKFS